MESFDANTIREIMARYKEGRKRAILDMADETGLTKQTLYDFLNKGTTPVVQNLVKIQAFLSKRGFLKGIETFPVVQVSKLDLPSKDDLYRLIQYVGENDRNEKTRAKWVCRIMAIRDEIIELESAIDKFNQKYQKILEELQNDYNNPIPS